LTVGQFIQLFVDGLSNGSIYAVLALAIVLVNQATGLVNFAQGGMAVLSAYLTWWFAEHGIALILAILLSVVASFLLGGLVERFAMRRFEGGDPDTAVVVTIGLLTLVTGLCGIIWGYNYLTFPWFFSTGAAFTVGGITISWWSVMSVVVIVVIMGLLQALFAGTKLGLALRAVADNPQSAALSGLRVGRLLMVGWGLAAVLGAIAGTIIAPKLQMAPQMLDEVLIYALAAVVIGGLDSPLGAVIAAFAVSVIQNLVAVYVSFIGSDLKIIVPFVIVVIVLALRPQGLFGRKQVVRV